MTRDASPVPSADFRDKTFFLGLGPAKTGSTWLYEYLRDHPEFCASPLKELHFFSARYHARTPQRFDQRIIARIKKLSEGSRLEKSRQTRNTLYHLAERLRMSDSPERYLQSFQVRIGERHRAFGEISPSYCALTAEGYRHVRSLHPQIKLLICLRDPLTRMDSAIRHMAKWGNPVSYDEFLARDIERKLEFHNMNYPRMLDTIFEAFEAKDVYIQFFEEMFNQPAIDRITKFIGIAKRPANFEKQPAHSPPADEMQPEHRARLLEALQPIYAECRTRFGDKIPASWTL